MRLLLKSAHDPRPESHTLRADTITLAEEVPATPDEWGKRAEIVLKSSHWQFGSMRDLRASGQSLAFVKPTSLIGVSIRKRAADDADTFQGKLEELKKRNVAARKQLDLFEQTLPPAMKNLEYMGERVCIDWRCADEDCTAHSMQILDWEICELASGLPDVLCQ